MTSILSRIAAATAGFALVLTACTSDDDGGNGDDIADRLSAARAALDDATSFQIAVTSASLPSGGNALVSATGVGNSSPAFEGSVEVRAFGTIINADVIAIGDTVWVDGIPGSSGYTELDPSTVGAPNPSSFFGDQGITSLIDDTEDLSEGDRERDANDSSVVITQVRGTIAGSAVQRFLPTADPDGTFDVVYALTDDDELRSVRITGPFYGADAGDATYTIEITGSEDPVDIVEP